MWENCCWEHRSNPFTHFFKTHLCTTPTLGGVSFCPTEGRKDGFWPIWGGVGGGPVAPTHPPTLVPHGGGRDTQDLIDCMVGSAHPLWRGFQKSSPYSFTFANLSVTSHQPQPFQQKKTKICMFFLGMYQFKKIWKCWPKKKYQNGKNLMKRSASKRELIKMQNFLKSK